MKNKIEKIFISPLTVHGEDSTPMAFFWARETRWVSWLLFRPRFRVSLGRSMGLPCWSTGRSVYFWFMSWIRYQFYRKKLGIIPSIKQGSRSLSKASALSLPVKVILKRSAYRAQETSRKLCMCASQVPPSTAGIYCIKRGAPIRWINKAIPSTVPSSHENEGGTAVMKLREFHALKKKPLVLNPHHA